MAVSREVKKAKTENVVMNFIEGVIGFVESSEDWMIKSTPLKVIDNIFENSKWDAGSLCCVVKTIARIINAHHGIWLSNIGINYNFQAAMQESTTDYIMLAKAKLRIPSENDWIKW